LKYLNKQNYNLNVLIGINIDFKKYILRSGYNIIQLRKINNNLNNQIKSFLNIIWKINNLKIHPNY